MKYSYRAQWNGLSPEYLFTTQAEADQALRDELDLRYPGEWEPSSDGPMRYQVRGKEWDQKLGWVVSVGSPSEDLLDDMFNALEQLIEDLAKTSIKSVSSAEDRTRMFRILGEAMSIVAHWQTVASQSADDDPPFGWTPGMGVRRQGDE